MQFGIILVNLTTSQPLPLFLSRRGWRAESQEGLGTSRDDPGSRMAAIS